MTDDSPATADAEEGNGGQPPDEDDPAGDGGLAAVALLRVGSRWRVVGHPPGFVRDYLEDRFRRR